MSGSRFLALLLTLGLLGSSAAGRGQEVERSEGLPGVSEPDAYARGLEHLEAGRWQDALDIWEDGFEELSGEGAHDPRLGFAFIETATRHEATERYTAATTIYLWGLTPPVYRDGADVLDEEVDRLRIIWDDAETERFGTAAEEGRDALLLEIKRWWIELDPIPATRENERLTEHWLRIRDARTRFQYNTRSAIDTDDRGEIYLRYGEPERISKGFLGANEQELRLRVPNTSARRRLRGYDSSPQYEVWVYESLNSEEFTAFLFGRDDLSGTFGLVDGVTDLIPRAAMSRNSSRNTPGGIPASFYLELFYYQDLSKVGGHFGRRFAELEQRWDGAMYRRRSFVSAAPLTPPESSLEALRFRYEEEDRNAPPTPPEVHVASEYDAAGRDEMVAQMIRTLSDDGTPLLVLVGTSAPRLTAEVDDAWDGELDFPEWVMRHTLVIRDRNLEEVGRLVQPISALRADVSSFVLRHVPEPIHLTLTARTLRISSDQQDTLVATDRLPALEHFTPAEPLVSDPERFVLSDLMTGTLIPPNINPASFPYPLLPTRKIWRSDALRLYLEFFNFGESQEAPGVGDLRARFVVVPLHDDLQPDFDRDPVALNVRLAPRAGRPYRETFDMQLRDQDLGFYRVEVEIRDEVRGTIERRSVVIELVD